MSNLLKSKFLLGVMAVTVMFVGVVAVSAGTASADCTVVPTVKVGSTGASVQCVQSKVGATADGVFGPMTRASVMAFQSNHGLSADGVVGPVTAAAMNGVMSSGSYPAGCTSASGYSTTTGMPCNSTSTYPAGCTSTAGYSPTTGAKCDSSTSGPSTSGPLAGGAGNLESADLISSINNEEVGESEEDVQVVGLEIEADDNSDLGLLSVRVLFENQHDHDAASSDDFDDYASEVSVWFDGKEVGREDVSDFSESGDVWSKTIALDGAIVRADDMGDLVVAVSAVNNLDSTDQEETWTVEVDSLRYEDGQGAILTETTLDGIGDARDFSFESFTTAADVEMKVSLSNDDDINDAHVIDVDTSDETDGVEVLSFEVEAEGDSDLYIDEMVVDFTTDEDDLNDVISNACIFADGEELACVNVTSEDATDVPVTFEDLDFTIDAGDTVVFTVEVDFEAIDASFVTGTTLLAEITDDETDLWDVEDEAGDNLADGEKTGTAASGAHGAYAVGIMAKYVSSTATAAPSGLAGVDDFGTFTITFDVTAFDSDIYVDGSAITDEAGGATYQNIVADGVAATAVIDCAACVDGANTTFKVSEGETERFVVTGSGAGDDVFANMALESILYALTAIDGDVVYSFDMSDYKTQNVFLSGND